MIVLVVLAPFEFEALLVSRCGGTVGMIECECISDSEMVKQWL